MKRQVSRILTLAAVAASIVSVGLGCARDASRDEPVTLVSPDMAYTTPYDSYDPNPVTANGATLLLPPDGTVPIDGTYFPFAAGKEEAKRAGLEYKNPIEASPEALKRGKHIFDTFCTICHGSEGNGDGPVIGRFPNPPSLHAERARTIADGEMFHIISKGQGLMAAYSAQVRPDDRWRAIHYIRTLQAAQAAK